MKKKISKYVSIACLIVFSALTFLLNFSFSNVEEINKVRKQKQLEITMEQERPFIEAMECWDDSSKTAEIKSMADFIEFRDAVNNKSKTFSGFTINLRTDLDFTGATFVPIGTINSETRYFSGIFNGNGHILRNVKIVSDSTNVKGDIGVFGYASNATINALTVIVDSMQLTTAGKSMGAIAGSTSGAMYINNCMIIAKSSSDSKIYTSSDNTSMNVGGVVGYCNATSGRIYRCANYVKVSCTVKGTASVGGIVGKFPSGCNIGVEECYSAGNVTGGGSSTTTVYAGGIAGCSESSSVGLTKCINESYITANTKQETSKDSSPYYSGNLRSIDDITISGYSKVYWDNKWYSNIYAGGIIGYGSGCSVTKCANLKNTYSVGANTYSDVAKYFYGSTGKGSGVGHAQSRYGDYVEYTFTQKITNMKEIGNNVSATTCYSYNFGPASSYYETSATMIRYDRVYHARLTGVSGKNLTFTALSNEELFASASSSEYYASSDSYDDGAIIIKINNRPAEIPATRYTLYDFVGYINYGYNLYKTVITSGYSYQFGTSVITPQYATNVSTFNFVSSTNTLANIDSPLYSNLGNTGYISGNYSGYGGGYLHNRYPRPSNYTKKDKYAIKNCEIFLSESSDGKTYHFNHRYAYDYYKNLSWKTTSVYDSPLIFGGAASRKSLVDNTPKGYYTTISDIGSQTSSIISSFGATIFINRNSKPMLSWLFWDQNTFNPGGSGGSSGTGGSGIKPGLPGGGKDIVQVY